MIYISDLLQQQDMKSVLHKTGAGVESIEFSISESLDHLEEKIKEYRSRMEYYGVTDLTLHGPFLDLNPMAYDSQIQKVTAYRFAQCYDAGMRLGAKKIIYHTCYIPTVYFLIGWADRMADFWNSFMKERPDMEILLENVLDPFPEPIREVYDKVTAPNFKLCLDIGHANCYSDISPIQWAQYFGDAVGHIHLHNNDGTGDAHLALENGTAPAKKILSTIRQAAPKATYTIECNTIEDVLSSYSHLQVNI